MLSTCIMRSRVSGRAERFRRQMRKGSRCKDNLCFERVWAYYGTTGTYGKQGLCRHCRKITRGAE